MAEKLVQMFLANISKKAMRREVSKRELAIEDRVVSIDKDIS